MKCFFPLFLYLYYTIKHWVQIKFGHDCGTREKNQGDNQYFILNVMNIHNKFQENLSFWDILLGDQGVSQLLIWIMVRPSLNSFEIMLREPSLSLPNFSAVWLLIEITHWTCVLGGPINRPTDHTDIGINSGTNMVLFIKNDKVHAPHLFRGPFTSGLVVSGPFCPCPHILHLHCTHAGPDGWVGRLMWEYVCECVFGLQYDCERMC